MLQHTKFDLSNRVYHPQSNSIGIITAIETSLVRESRDVAIRYRINPFGHSEDHSQIWASQDQIAFLPELPQVTINAPKIGTAWQGGIYAGVVAGQDGQPDYHLIHAPAEFEIKDANWQTAIEKAQAPINGFNDWSLPDRREARLLYINTPAGFDTAGWYWTSTQNAGGPDYAWMQGFGNGGQYDGHKSDEYRARAVRRLLIIQ
ncbi:hypothetical protein UNDKW_1638 [Undibacterium sp. KW1]|uniref:Lcl C-terminal domain-containing protein n=1 Tax=Undibacterium sp. KW1 TaxID=2058624 RepID=UPI001331DCB0|nr:DUF1566 domain-containing protein [Undibacterium sp. KW1]BBB59911.1 hypothetical protein UNDKW_1638 [Undibacterium sp. KW1]